MCIPECQIRKNIISDRVCMWVASVWAKCVQLSGQYVCVCVFHNQFELPGQTHTTHTPVINEIAFDLSAIVCDWLVLVVVRYYVFTFICYLFFFRLEYTYMAIGLHSSFTLFHIVHLVCYLYMNRSARKCIQCARVCVCFVRYISVYILGCGVFVSLS